ncbi:hypothetical protein PAL_GLEAN10009974 [Pteropus alecto]|uniref:Uncharacterized protein n=1 Tax=Pteropus alecto TaxID=9402 RepID=L5KD40_PTEAL|nr:hypothetical protein PAL_GLEAN10009974 [Pteropus alecto]
MQLGSELKVKQVAASSSRWLAELGLGRPPSCPCCKVRDDLSGAHTRHSLHLPPPHGVQSGSHLSSMHAWHPKHCGWDSGRFIVGVRTL